MCCEFSARIYSNPFFGRWLSWLVCIDGEVASGGMFQPPVFLPTSIMVSPIQLLRHHHLLTWIFFAAHVTVLDRWDVELMSEDEFREVRTKLVDSDSFWSGYTSFIRGLHLKHSPAPGSEKSLMPTFHLALTHTLQRSFITCGNQSRTSLVLLFKTR